MGSGGMGRRVDNYYSSINGKGMTQVTTTQKAKIYANQEIQCNGITVHFYGKYDPSMDTLKVYRYYGDITIKEQALQDFAISNGIGCVVIL